MKSSFECSIGRLAGTAFLATALLWVGPAWGQSTTIDTSGTFADSYSGDVYVTGSNITMNSGASLTVDGRLETLGSTGPYSLNLQAVTVGKSIYLANATAAFNGNSTIRGFGTGMAGNIKALSLSRNSQMTLATGKALTITQGALDVHGGSELILGDGSILTVSEVVSGRDGSGTVTLGNNAMLSSRDGLFLGKSTVTLGNNAEFVIGDNALFFAGGDSLVTGENAKFNITGGVNFGVLSRHVVISDEYLAGNGPSTVTLDIGDMTVGTYIFSNDATVAFNGDVTIKGTGARGEGGYGYVEALTLGSNSRMTLAAGKAITINQGDVGVYTGSALTLGEGSTLTANSGNVVIGSEYGIDGVVFDESGTVTLGTGATLSASGDGFFFDKNTVTLGNNAVFSIGGDAHFIKKGNTTVTLGNNAVFSIGGDAYFIKGGSTTVTGESNAAFTVAGNAFFGVGSYFDGMNTWAATGESRVDVGFNTLTITGDAYFLTGSTYKLAHTESANGVINVNGTVYIGGTVEGGEAGSSSPPDYDYTPGGVAPKIIIDGARSIINDNNKVVLTAGSFNNDTVFSNPLYTFKIVNGTDLIIDQYKGSEGVVGEVASAVGKGMSGNYINAKDFMDRIIGKSSVTSAILIDNLQKIYEIVTDNPTLAEIALKQLIGESSLTAINAYQDTLVKVGSTMNSRFQAIHGNNAPAAGSGPNESRVWMGGFGQWGRQKNTDNFFGYNYNSVGVMLGYDREVVAVPGLTLGLAGNWASGKLENNDGYAETDIDSFGFGLYSVYEFGDGFFLDADLGYGHANNDSTINLILGGKKTGEFSSNSFQAGLNFGYDFRLGAGSTTLTPSAGLRFTHVKQKGWEERIVNPGSEGLALANWFGDSSQNYVEIPLNLKLATTIETSGGAVISPELRVGWIIAANDPSSELRMGFVGSDDSALISGIDPGRSRSTVGAGLKAQVNDTVDIFAGYDLEIRDGYRGHSASIGVGFSF